MTVLSAAQVADYWIQAGGPASRVVEWVAIAYGESGFDAEALSSAGAIGVYQIMPFNAAPHGVSVQDLYDPLINTRVAVEMSGGGVNCAAWDSAYADINATGRLAYLSWPQPGSADYNNLHIVSVMLGNDKLGGMAPPIGAAAAEQINQTTAQLNTISSKLYPALMKSAIAQTQWINAAFIPGWRA